MDSDSDIEIIEEKTLVQPVNSTAAINFKKVKNVRFLSQQSVAKQIDKSFKSMNENAHLQEYKTDLQVISVEKDENMNWKNRQVSNQNRSVSGVLKNKNPEVEELPDPPSCFSVIIKEKINLKRKPFYNSNESAAPPVAKTLRLGSELSFSLKNPVADNQLSDPNLSDSNSSTCSEDSMRRLLQLKDVTLITSNSSALQTINKVVSGTKNCDSIPETIKSAVNNACSTPKSKQTEVIIVGASKFSVAQTTHSEVKAHGASNWTSVNVLNGTVDLKSVTHKVDTVAETIESIANNTCHVQELSAMKNKNVCQSESAIITVSSVNQVPTRPECKPSSKLHSFLVPAEGRKGGRHAVKSTANKKKPKKNHVRQTNNKPEFVNGCTSTNCKKNKSSSIKVISKNGKKHVMNLGNTANFSNGALSDDDNVFLDSPVNKSKSTVKRKLNLENQVNHQVKTVVSKNDKKSMKPSKSTVKNTASSIKEISRSKECLSILSNKGGSDAQVSSACSTPGSGNHCNINIQLISDSKSNSLAVKPTMNAQAQPLVQNVSSPVTVTSTPNNINLGWVSNNIQSCQFSVSLVSNCKSGPSTPTKNEVVSPWRNMIGPGSSKNKSMPETPESNSPDKGAKKIKLSPGISSSPGKYFGSPKSKSSGGSPTKNFPGKFSPFRKANRSKTPQSSSQKSLDQYFVKNPPKINLFKAGIEDDQGNEDIPGISKIDSYPTPKIQSTSSVKQVISIENKKVDVPASDLDFSAKTINSSDKTDSRSYSQIYLGSEEVDDIFRMALEIQEVDKGKDVIGLDIQSDNAQQPKLMNKKEKNKTEQVDEKLNGDASFFYHKALINVTKNAIKFIEIADEQYLFSQYDRKIIKSFFEDLSTSAQYLYSRLLSRKFSWIRKVSMKYPGISSDLDEELLSLNGKKFITLDHTNEDLQLILSLLNNPELKQLCKLLNVQCGGNKSEMIDSLLKRRSQQVLMPGSSEDSEAIIRRYASKMLGLCGKLTEEPRNTFFKCMRLFMFIHCYDEREQLYGTLLEKSSSKHRFPDYEFKPVKVFYSLENYNEYEEALKLQADMNALGDKRPAEMLKLLIVAKENFVKIITNPEKMDLARRMPDFMRRYTAGSVYGRCISSKIDNVFNRANKKNAIEYYECLLNQNVFLVSKRGHLYVKLITILFHHSKNYEKMVEYFKKAQCDNINLVAQNALHEQACLVKSRKNVPERLKLLLEDFNVQHVVLNNSLFNPVTILARAMPSLKPGVKRVYVTECEEHTEYSSVEELALNHWTKNLGYPKGIVDEGKLLIEVLLSCFWDIIYCSPDGISVFPSWFQHEPADWMSSSFYKRRKSLIEERLKEMSGGHSNIKQFISTCCNTNESVSSVIKWNYVSKVRLCTIMEFVECMPVKFIVETAHHLLKDFKAFHSGLPDLTLWNPVQKKSIFIEVKGPNDQLSNTQKLWLQNIKNFGGDATICYVQDTSSGHTKRMLPSGPGGKRKKSPTVADSQDF